MSVIQQHTRSSLGYVFLRTHILRWQQQMIGEDIVAITSPAQYEGLSGEQEDISQSRGGTQLCTTTHSKKTKIVLAVISAALVIYLSASFYVAVTQLAAEGLVVVGAVNILIVICAGICMCIYTERRKGMRPAHTAQDSILSDKEVSLGSIEHDGLAVTENSPHQDLHYVNTRSFPAASASDAAPTLALQLGPLAPTGDTGKKTPIASPVIITTKAEVVPLPSPQFSSTILELTNTQTPTTESVTAPGADSPSGTKPPLVPKRSKSNRNAGLDSSTQQHLPPLPPKRFGSPKHLGVSSLSKHLGSPQQKSTILTTPVENTSKQIPATKPTTMISADSPSGTKPPLVPKRSKSNRNAGLDSSTQQHLPPLPEGVQLLSSGVQQHGASQIHNEPKIDDLLGIDELFAAALKQSSPQQAGDIASSTRKLEHEPALIDQSQSLPEATGHTLQPDKKALATKPTTMISADSPSGTKPPLVPQSDSSTLQPGISALKLHMPNQSALPFKAVASAVKRGTIGNSATKLQSGVRKVQRGLLKKVSHATGTPTKWASTRTSCYGRSSAIEKPYSPAHADATILDTDPDTRVITHYKSRQPHNEERSGALADDLRPANWEARSTVTGADEERKAVDAQYQKARVAGAPYGLDVTPSAAKPTATLQKIKKRAASLSKAVTRAAHVAYIGAELAFGIYDAVPSKTYSFQLAPEISAGGFQDVYLLIRGKNGTHLAALSTISEVKGRTLWLCTGALYTKRGHISISNLEFRIMSAGDEHSLEYKSQYQIALKLIMPSFGAVPHLLTSAQHEFSISHSGKSRDLFLTTRVSTNRRTNIIKLVATSATFKSYRKAFFYIYTESVIHAMVKHMNVIMCREFAHLDQQSLTVCAALDMYANQNYIGMMRAITDFFIRDPLGIAVYSDTALCIEYIRELIRFYTSSDDYPAYHALFWKLVVQEVWGCSRCGPTGIPRYDWHASEYDKAFVTDLHVICALICKKQAMTDREEVYSFIEKIMQMYGATSDSLGTRLAHYLALATVASPRLNKGIKALDIQHERWKKLLRIAEHTLKLYKLDAEASTIKALSKTSGAKHPCRINALLLSDFTETAAYKIALQNDQKLQQLRNILGPDYMPHQLALASDSVVQIVDKHTHTKEGKAIPYAVLVSHLQDVYSRVEGKYYSQNIIPKLLLHWADIRTRNPSIANKPACKDAQEVIRLLEAKVPTTRYHARGDAPSSLSPGTRLISCTTSYPFSGRTLERIGDAALTRFLSVVSVSPAMRELNLLQPECSIHLDVARAIT